MLSTNLTFAVLNVYNKNIKDIFVFLSFLKSEMAQVVEIISCGI